MLSRIRPRDAVLNIDPDASALESTFDPVASYELKIDTDGDLEADVAFHVLFASPSERGSTASVYRSTGSAARASRTPCASDSTCQSLRHLPRSVVASDDASTPRE
jgi:hypothetical protein